MAGKMSAVTPRSALRDIVWPALPDEANARALALQFQFEESERWPPAEIEAQQFRQIEHLVAFCATSVPFWRDRLRKAGLRGGQKLNRQTWHRLPVLTRREAQDAGDRLRPARLPPGHGNILTGATSGSTAAPLSYARSELSAYMTDGVNLRLPLWHDFDFSQSTVLIRTLPGTQPITAQATAFRDWGGIFAAFPTGPSWQLDIRLPPEQQLAWLEREQPGYIITFPSNIELLARVCLQTGRRLPSLRGINSYGEVLTEDVRLLAREAFGLPVIDAYSSEEGGFLAIQCPSHAHLHVMSEFVRMEILDERNRPCAPGEVGRVVITPLHNFAMPLLRYETGDYAELGGSCDCGRTLPVLNRLLGRTRDFVRLPNGERRLAMWGAPQFHRVRAIIQHQVAQVGPEQIECRLVVRQPLTAEEETFLMETMQRNFGYPFAIRFVYVDHIPRLPSGKFLDFSNEIAAPS